MEVIKGGVTAAEGFKAASCEANIKYKDRTDMAFVYSEAPCVCAGTFTSNGVKPASSNPRDNPPQPANKSMKVCLGAISTFHDVLKILKKVNCCKFSQT